MISTLCKFKVDATAGTDAAEAIGDAKLSIETICLKKSLLNYLKVSIQIFWMDLRLGILSKLDLLLVAYGIYYSLQETKSRKQHQRASIRSPISIRFGLEDIDLMTLHSLASGLQQLCDLIF